MRHIEIGTLTPDAAWLVKANALTQQLLGAATLAARHQIIDDNDGVWGEVKTFLKDISYGKCWYSEAREDFSYMHVDHFRPKKRSKEIDKKYYGGYWWLAFDWKNYRYCGSIGNVNKQDKFAVKNAKANSNLDPIDDELYFFLDPLRRSDTEKITFDHEGKIVPLSTLDTDWDFIRAKYTIDNLKLNDDGLKEARKKVWHECASLIKEIAVLLGDIQSVPSVAKQQKIEDKIIELKKYLKKEAEYSSTALACCITSGYVWAMRMAA